MNKVLYMIVNILLAGTFFILGISLVVAVWLLLIVFGIYLIIKGFANVGEDYYVREDGSIGYSSAGSQIFTLIAYIVAGIGCFKLYGKLVSSEWFDIVAGLVFVVLGVLRLRSCRQEPSKHYVPQSANILGYVYPFMQMAGGVALCATFKVESLSTLACVLFTAASVVWIVRAVLVVREN